MPYTVSTPRRFDFETRLFGLTLKQWGYLSVGVAVAGLIGLGVLIPGLPLGVRIALGLVVMAPPAAMAYLKVRGLELDRALLAWVRYRRDPRHRVWRKRCSRRCPGTRGLLPRRGVGHMEAVIRRCQAKYLQTQASEKPV